MYFYARCCYGKDKWSSVCNHFGVATLPRPDGDLIWIHAASIGESTSALTYINELAKTHPQLHVLLTTITVTSADILEKKLKTLPNCFHQFVVADNPRWVKKFLDYWRPQKAIFLESEIWPNVTEALSERKIPSFLINARLSPRSFARWKKFASFFSQILARYNCILAQSKTDAERFACFSKNNVKQMDNLKYAGEKLSANEKVLQILRHRWAEKKILVVASTHEGEEEIILRAHAELRKKFNLVTVIIPRHINRTPAICDLIKKCNLQYQLFSELKNGDENETATADAEIFCVDVFGEVGTFFRLADLTFVGGSLVPIGGHNIYEPVALGKLVIHGPHMNNALEMRDFLHERGVAFEVNSAEDICSLCGRFFSQNSNQEKLSKIAELVGQNNSIAQINACVWGK